MTAILRTDFEPMMTSAEIKQSAITGQALMMHRPVESTARSSHSRISEPAV